LWQLEWGQYLNVLERRAKRGEPTPALEDRPVLYEDLLYVWQAFNELHTGRQSGFGPAPFAPGDILAWMNIHGFTEVEERVELYELLLAMDSTWLMWADDRRKRKKPKEEDKDADTKGRNRRK
jgi:hypothetical protein